MKFNSARHHRRSIRLKGYDYKQPGAYFVTICAQDRECLFGDIVEGTLRLNDAGHMVQTTWDGLPTHYPGVGIDAFVVMPNHAHGIIVLNNDFVGAGLKPARTPMKRHGLPEIVRAFKTFSSRHINQWRGTPGVPVWQRNYYEHVIRKESELDRVREYISANPARWDEDVNNPARMDDIVGADFKSAHEFKGIFTEG